MKNDILVKMTSELMRFKTTKDNYDEKKSIISFVKEQFKEKKVFIREFEKNKNPSLVITLGRGRKPKIFLNGHLDVVPADDQEYTAKIGKRRIYGRGSGDMKAACAVMIEVMKHFSACKKRPSLGLMLTTDEEVGGKDGVEYLLKNKKFSSDLAIIPDGGTDLKNIVLKEKGVLHLKIKAYGKSAHGSRPFLGENAVEKLIKSYLRLRKVIPELTEKRWQNTMNLGKFSGGDTVNKVPDWAEMYLDIRYTQKADKDDIIRKIKKIVPIFEIISEGAPFIQNKHRHIKSFKKVMERNIGQKVLFSRVEGASDARYFSEMGIPAIITKIKAKNIHSRGEWVDIREMGVFYDSLVEFIKEF